MYYSLLVKNSWKEENFSGLLENFLPHSCGKLALKLPAYQKSFEWSFTLLWADSLCREKVEKGAKNPKD